MNTEQDPRLHCARSISSVRSGSVSLAVGAVALVAPALAILFARRSPALALEPTG